MLNVGTILVSSDALGLSRESITSVIVIHANLDTFEDLVTRDKGRVYEQVEFE